MLSTYHIIGLAIADQVKQVRWIDLDKGQLEDPERFNSLVLPSVLIGQSDIDWKQLAARQQQGDGILTVKTVLHLSAQTHLTDPLFLENLKQLDLGELVNDAVLSVPGVISLTNYKDYPEGTYYVLEHTYSVSFKRGPAITYKTVAVNFNPSLNIPTATA